MPLENKSAMKRLNSQVSYASNRIDGHRQQEKYKTHLVEEQKPGSGTSGLHGGQEVGPDGSDEDR